MITLFFNSGNRKIGFPLPDQVEDKFRGNERKNNGFPFSRECGMNGK